jgi:thiol-disulfide isomerase/thioredoxin
LKTSRRLGTVALLVGLAAWPESAATAQEEIGISRGSVANPIQLEDLDGETVDLGDRFGRKPVLLEFWALWCENCEALAPRLDAAYETYRDRLDFFAVAVGVGQNPRSIRRHLRRHPIPFPVLWDEHGEGVRAFMTPATSYIVIVDGEGKVAYTGIGREQNVEEAILGVLER